MSTTKSPKRVLYLEDSTNIYLKNLDTLSFMRRLNEIKERSTKCFENKFSHRKNALSIEANSKF